MKFRFFLLSLVAILQLATAIIPSRSCRNFDAWTLDLFAGTTYAKLSQDINGDMVKDYAIVNYRNFLLDASIAPLDGAGQLSNFVNVTTAGIVDPLGIETVEFGDQNYSIIVGDARGKTTKIFTSKNYWSNAPTSRSGASCTTYCHSPLRISQNATGAYISLLDNAQRILYFFLLKADLSINGLKSIANMPFTAGPVVSIGDVDDNGVNNFVVLADREGLLMFFEVDVTAKSLRVTHNITLDPGSVANFKDLVAGDVDGDGDRDLILTSSSIIPANATFVFLRPNGTLHHIEYLIDQKEMNFMIFDQRLPSQLLLFYNDYSGKFLRQYCQLVTRVTTSGTVSQGSFDNVFATKTLNSTVLSKIRVRETTPVYSVLKSGIDIFQARFSFAFPSSSVYTSSVLSAVLTAKFAAPSKQVTTWTFSYKTSSGTFPLFTNNVSQNNVTIVKSFTLTPSGSSGTIPDYSSYLDVDGLFRLVIESSNNKSLLYLDFVGFTWKF